LSNICVRPVPRTGPGELGFAIGDMTFQANMGPSFESHQYLIAGQNGGYQATHFADIGNPMQRLAPRSTPGVARRP